MGKSPGLKLQAAVVQDNVPVEVAPRVFVGSIHAAFNIEALQEKHITHIINLAGNYATFPESFTYLSISIRDKDYSNLLSCLPMALMFVDAGISSGTGVLIHCAGGRSRSPAIAMAYLMIKDQVTFEKAYTHMRTIRPVVSLNTGFEAQLRCLDDAHGDVFTAHQLVLQYRLATMVQQRADGFLDMELLKKKRRHRHHQPHYPSHQAERTESYVEEALHSRAGKSPHRGSHEYHTTPTFCDERGMLHGRVPSGFNLSTPLDLKASPHFIPALRCMGTMFGCSACGENLFNASSILTHAKSKEGVCVAKDTEKHEGIDEKASRSESGPQPRTELTSAPSSKAKRPLLAKLRLRPRSPGLVNDKVLSPETKRHSDPPAPTTPVLKHPKKDKDKEKVVSPTHQTKPAASESKPKEEKHGHEGFWRTLTNFRSSKRNIKDAVAGRSGNEDQKKKQMTLSPKSIDLSPREDPHLQFLRENAQQWERKVKEFEHATDQTVAETSSSDVANQLSMLMAHDAQRMSMLDCDAWFIEPQEWFTQDMGEASHGTIVCPNERCGGELGAWHWGGLNCSCGGTVAPAFQLQKSALRVLGNVTIPPEQLLEPPMPAHSSSSSSSIFNLVSPAMTPRHTSRPAIERLVCASE
ncbi:hypothetical protein Poli38472_008398 [Pythium oligandrum]|uniref:protein-tyrosine-phosphatase n=1 Tax=Pythium oligandrum TaxID=41045 RepID=A0A8K1CNA5_PYTOL|nr:hypothetical protein Poli38472_008398 [Pythium oligandrum]|eukprot:TMW65756.1 hypothetical protein Poli38472_008398 [Pythium oligandrum]